MRIEWWRRAMAAAALVACTAALAACGGSDSGGGGATDGGKRAQNIAFLSPSAANTYISQTWEAMQRLAARRGVKLTEFDAAFDIAKQQQQLQAVIASNRYQGIVISPMGNALTADLEAPATAGLKLAVVGGIIGPNLDTTAPQVKGVEVSVLSPPVTLGRRMGDMVLRACEGKDPCRVVYFYGIKGGVIDNAYLKGFQEVIARNKAVKIVATGEGKYQGPDVALAAMQNILQSTPDFDVVVGADQSMQGVQLALQQAGKLDKVAIVGLGGSQAALEAITAGKWFGGVMTAPQTEGELALGNLLDVIDKGAAGTPQGIDPLTRIPHGGLITSDNAKDIEPQWKG